MEKKIILATLGGAVTSFLVGGLIFGVLLKDMMAEGMKAFEGCAYPEPPVLPVVLASIVIALLMSILLNRFGVSTFKGGLITAAWITLLIIVWFDLWMFATFSAMSIKLMLVDVCGNTAVGALAGGVIGWILGKVK